MDFHIVGPQTPAPLSHTRRAKEKEKAQSSLQPANQSRLIRGKAFVTYPQSLIAQLHNFISKIQKLNGAGQSMAGV